MNKVDTFLAIPCLSIYSCPVGATVVTVMALRACNGIGRSVGVVSDMTAVGN